MAGPTFDRYRFIRRADNLADDQATSAQIGLVLTSTTSQEDVQRLFLSRLRQVIWGDNAPHHWHEDFLGEGVLSLVDLSGITAPVYQPQFFLIGPKDGTNRIFRTTPFHFRQDAVFGIQIEVFHNGRRLIQGAPTDTAASADYTV